MSKTPTGARGFTLTEAVVATVIVGLGAAAILTSAASGTRANEAGRKLTQASFLAQELHEWALRLPFEAEGQTDLADLDGATYDPPLDGRGQPVTGVDGWSQYIKVTWRDPNNLTSVVADGTSDIVHIEVSVSHDGTEILKTGWLAVR